MIFVNITTPALKLPQYPTWSKLQGNKTELQDMHILG